MKNKKEGLLFAGLLCILFAIIFKYNFDESRLTDLFQGLFMGASVVFNLLYIIQLRLSRVI